MASQNLKNITKLVKSLTDENTANDLIRKLSSLTVADQQFINGIAKKLLVLDEVKTLSDAELKKLEMATLKIFIIDKNPECAPQLSTVDTKYTEKVNEALSLTTQVLEKKISRSPKSSTSSKKSQDNLTKQPLKEDYTQIINEQIERYNSELKNNPTMKNNINNKIEKLNKIREKLDDKNVNLETIKSELNKILPKKKKIKAIKAKYLKYKNKYLMLKKQMGL